MNITSEHIERKALLKKAKELAGGSFSTPLIISAIENAPTADVVEVVRCKDCCFCSYHPTSDTTKMCTNPKWSDEFYPLVQDNDFCSYGVRKEGEENG